MALIIKTKMDSLSVEKNRTVEGLMKSISLQKIKIFLVILVATITIPFIFSSCKRNNSITLENYKDYIEISSRAYTTFDNGPYIPTASVGIEKRNHTLSNIKIAYKISIFYKDKEEIYFEEIIEVELNNLEENYSKIFLSEKRLMGYETPNFSWLSINSAIEVLEVSGTVTTIHGKGAATALVVVTVFAGLIGLLLFFPIRAAAFSNKMNTVSKGMTYQEVVAIVGEPYDSRTEDGITTSVWKRAVWTWRVDNHVLTFKDNKLLTKSEHNGSYGWFF